MRYLIASSGLANCAAAGEISGDPIRTGYCGYLSGQGHEPAAGGEAMNQQLTTVRVWSLPTRAFHCALAACGLASIATAWVGGNARFWHFRLGCLACALPAFRRLALQLATGLFADHESSKTGPRIEFAQGATSLAPTGWHQGYGQWPVIALIVLHVGWVVGLGG